MPVILKLEVILGPNIPMSVRNYLIYKYFCLNWGIFNCIMKP